MKPYEERYYKVVNASLLKQVCLRVCEELDPEGVDIAAYLRGGSKTFVVHAIPEFDIPLLYEVAMELLKTIGQVLAVHHEAAVCIALIRDRGRYIPRLYVNDIETFKLVPDNEPMFIAQGDPVMWN